MAEGFRAFTQPVVPWARGERRHRPDRPGPLPQGDRQGGPRGRAVPRLAVRGGRIEEGPAVHPRPAGNARPQDPARRRQLRHRQLPRARPVGAPELGHPGDPLDELRGHLQEQLAQERRPADRRRPGHPRAPVRPRRRRPRRRAARRPRRAGGPPAGRQHDRLRHRPVQQDDADGRHGRDRLRAGEGGRDRRLGGRAPAAGRHPARDRRSRD